MQPSPQTRLHLNLALLPWLVALLVLLQLIAPFRGWMMLLVGLGGAWLLGYLWARALGRGLRLQREMRYGWAQVGDALEERFTLHNHSWAPGLWVEVVDQSAMPDYSVSRVTGVAPEGETHWRTRGLCTRRGLWTLGPTELRSGDPFGFYTVTQYYPASTSLVVMPPIIPLPSIEVSAGGASGEGRPRPYSFEETVNAAAVRAYQPGDPPRNIHWPTTARQGTLFTRLFDGAPSSDWWIILDVEERVQAETDHGSTEEQGVLVAASLADRGLSSGRRVGLAAYGQEPVWLAASDQGNQRLAILRALAMLEPGSEPIGTLLARASSLLGRASSLILITPDLEGGWLDPLLSLLRGGAVPTVLLLHPASGDRVTTPGIAPILSRLGIAHYLISGDILDRAEARPGEQGRWKWKVLGTGRVVSTSGPQEMAWKTLS